VGDVPYARFMEVRVFDSWVHEQDVRLALGRPGGGGGLASCEALNQVQSAMGYVVGKKAAAPDGTVVLFCVTGPGADERQFALAVENGRARPGASGATPTVSLALSSIDFVRLGCGRATSREVEAAGGIGRSGDAGIANRILESMSFLS
jgi:hypothetical protein